MGTSQRLDVFAALARKLLSPKNARLGGWVLLGLAVSNCSARDVKQFAEGVQRKAESVGAEQQANRPLAYPADILDDAPVVVQAPESKPTPKTDEVIEEGEAAAPVQPPAILFSAPPASAPGPASR